MAAFLLHGQPTQAAWQPAVEVSASGQHASSARLALDASGVATAVWSASDGIVRAAERPAGGSWQPPQALSAAGQGATRPDIGVDARGGAVVVWSTATGAVQSVTRDGSGSWQAPVDVAIGNGPAHVAVAANGDAVAVWIHRSDATTTVVQAVERAAAGDWQAPVNLSVPLTDQYGGYGEPRVTIDPHGRATAAWHSISSDDFTSAVQSAARPAGGGWETPATISTDARFNASPEIVVDPQGTAIVVWAAGGVWGGAVKSSARAPGESWQAPVVLAQRGANAQVAAAASGTALAVWDSFLIPRIGVSASVSAAVRPAGGGPWQTATQISPTGEDQAPPRVLQTTSPKLGLDADGNAVVIWQNRDATSFDEVNEVTVQAVVRPAGGGWSKPTVLARGYVSDVQVAVRGPGDALGLWIAPDGVVRSATYRGSASPPRSTPPRPPRLSKLRVSPRAFRAPARPGRSVGGSARSGTRVSYTLSAPAAVRFTVARLRVGRRVGGRCVPAVARNRRSRNCMRAVRVRGGFGRSRPAGSDRFTFTGRLVGRPLRPGHYRLIATPAGGRAITVLVRVLRGRA